MYNQFISNLQAQRASLLEQIEHIDAMLRLNGISVEDANTSHAGAKDNLEMPYKRVDGWQIKLASLIKSANRFLSINEAATMVNSFEPKVSIDDAKKGLGSAKNILLKAKSIVKIQVGTNNTNSFYGSPAWINADGSIKSEHKYKDEALHVKPHPVLI